MGDLRELEDARGVLLLSRQFYAYTGPTHGAVARCERAYERVIKLAMQANADPRYWTRPRD